VAKVWAAEDAGAVVYGSRAAVAGAGAAAAVDALARLRAAVPAAAAGPLAFHLALRGDSALRGGGVLPAADGDHGGLVEAQLDVVAPCALAADAKAAPATFAAAVVSRAADLANRAGAAPDEPSFGGVAEAVDGAAPGPLADAVAVAAAPADAVAAPAVLVALAAGRGADAWGGGTLRYGAGALRSAKLAEDAVHDLEKLRVVSDGGAAPPPVALHVLLPPRPGRAAYAPCVIRCVLWTAGAAGGANDVALRRWPAMVRENVYDTAEGAAAPLDAECGASTLLDDALAHAAESRWRDAYACDHRLALSAPGAARTRERGGPGDVLGAAADLAPLDARLAAHGALLGGVVDACLRLEASAAALRALLGLPRVLRAAAPPAAVAAHAAALVDGVEALAASPQAVHFAGAARYLVARLRGGDATARPGDVEPWAPTSLVVAAAAAAVAARLEDADLANGRQPNVSTKVAASRSRAVALAATRDVDDYLRALRRASEVNAHVGDPDMPTHFAVLRWGRPDDAGSPRSARRAGVSDRGLESSPTRRRGTLALPILPT